jgi:hypothetical protein
MNKTTFKYYGFIKCSFYSLIFLLFQMSTNSCKKNDLIPSYIHIDHITLSSVYQNDGSNSNKITDAWVYVDDDLIGIYELPATFPVLASGSHKISVKAGIKINGIAKSRGYYPFYQTYNTTINLKQEEIDTIQPVVSYVPGKIQWKEDFEDAGISIVKYGESDTTIVKTSIPNEVFEGSYSGVANLDASKPYVLCVSDSSLEIPQNQSPVFLEMNYKTNVLVTVGFYGTLTSGSVERIPTLVLNPTDEWKKIYINLTLSANYTVNTEGFKVFFEANKPDSLTYGKLLIDNVKLLYSK